MESSTKILRRLLDERGVEYDTDDKDGCEFTEWVANGLEWEADSRGELVSLMPVMLITPEQAIAATLGATDAKPTQVESSGTCHITDNGPWGYPYVCSACGASFDPDVNNGEFNFCPNCGRRIVEPTTNDVGAEVDS